MDPWLMRERLHRAQIARLATITEHGWPHLVPCCFVLAADSVYTAIDAKPKPTLELRRIANISAHPQVSLLVDHYEDDWSRLWWIRIDGPARVVTESREADQAIAHLTDKYAQYRVVPIPGPVVAVDVRTWRGWP